MKWISASKACQTNKMRVLVDEELGSRRREAKYAAPRIARVERRERTVAVSIRGAFEAAILRDYLGIGQFSVWKTIRFEVWRN